jgi:drug/metabolite transporter (DMT)-like permease
MSNQKGWMFYAMITTILWGVWGALIELPEKAGFPATLGYAVWAITLIPVSTIALKRVGWKLDTQRRNVVLALLAGAFGCGGQIILFQVLRIGPAYLVFPLISLYPVVTIFLSVVFLKEKASKRSWAGIILALIAIILLSYQPSENDNNMGYLWLFLSMVVFLLWGGQAYIMKLISDTNQKNSINAESITFYTMVSALLLIPVVLIMTDFSENINWGLSGIYSAGLIQSLNAVGFLFFAYAVKYGKAIVVVPMMSLAPIVTVILSLALYAVIPGGIIILGMVVAFVAIYLMSE